MSDPFAIEIISYTENEDGSANVEFEVNKEGAKYLIGLGFLKLMEDAVAKEEQKVDD